MESKGLLHPVRKLNHMQLIKSISIPQPCHENWNQMTPVDKGRHCTHCSKIVADFTVMSNTEIINYFTQNGNVCGRFGESQLVNLNNYLAVEEKTRFSWKKIALAATLASLFTTVKAQMPVTIGKIVVTQSPNRITEKPVIDTLTYTLIKGRIISNDDNNGLPGVTVRIKGTNKGTMTNAFGEFDLNVPSTADTLLISLIGFKTLETSVASLKDHANCISLCMQAALMGEVVIVKVPFYKRWWYKLKHIF